MTKLFKKTKARTQNLSLEANESQDDNRMVLDLLGVTISAIHTTKDLLPIDLPKGILGTIANILTIAQSVIKNKSDFLLMVQKCDNIRRVLERVTKGATDDELQGPLGDALSDLNISINRINSEMASKREKSIWDRIFSVTIDRDHIIGWEKDLDRILGVFNTEAIAGIAIGMKKLTLERKDGANGTNVLKHRPKIPPSRPSMFYGRNDLVAELTNLVINDEHIALIGPGGMGKSSLAKAILNEPLVTEKFAEQRFFITYDGLDPSTITLESFMTRFARVLGLELAGADPLYQICTFLRYTTALIVLDNAETFEEASESSALHQIPQAISDIADIPGTTLILTSRSRRNAPNVPWITKDIPPLDVNSALEAFFRIYRQANRSNSEEEITSLLREVEFHPLSINLLANAAQQNVWSSAMLLESWKCQPGAVLDHGEGKLQNLSATMQLSLSSPSIQDLGENGCRALTVIAFLPQGLNHKLAGHLLPSLPNINKICDVLCRQSLVYRQGTFIKILAPIRHFVQNSSFAALISTCLPDIRAFYYRTIRQCSQERDNHADTIISDHRNIEHVVAFGLNQITIGTNETYDICPLFLQCLQWHFPRPTTLSATIFNIVDISSLWKSKADCLWCLGQLYDSISHLTEALKIFQTAEALYLATGVHEGAADCVATRADTYRCEGHFIQVQEILEDFQRSESWECLSEAPSARVWFILDVARMYMFTAPADELFSRPMRSREWGLWFKIWHWRAKLYHGDDIVQVKTHLEELLLQVRNTGHPNSREVALQGLAEVAFYQGRLSESIDILQKIIDMYEEKNPRRFFWFTIWKAVVVNHQGNHDLARGLIDKASEQFEFLAMRTARAFLHRSYSSAQVEIGARAYDKAVFHFNATIEGCDIQGNLQFKALSLRGLGEVAFACGNFALAAQHFAETRSLCTEMGMPPRNMYSCAPFSILPAQFAGWVSFLDGWSPVANAI